MTDTVEKSFWGLIVRPEKRYEQEVEESFHISKACLEPASVSGSKDGGLTSIYIEVENEEFLVCNLNTGKLDGTLDLNFVSGEKICFRTEGPGTIHLTGYLIPDEMDNPYMSDEDDDDMEEESEEEEIPALVNGKNKRKGDDEMAVAPKKKLKEETPLDKVLADKKKKGLDLKAPQNEAELKVAIKKAEEMQKKVAAEAAKMKALQGDSDDDDDEDDDSDDEIGEGEEEEDEYTDMEDEEDDEDDESDEEEEPKKDAKKAKAAGDATKGTNGAATPEGKKNKKGQETPIKKELMTPTKIKKEQQQTPGKKGEKVTANGSPAKTPKTPKKTLKGGIVAEDLKEGTGPEAKRGKMIGMFYDGRLATNNKRFDSKQSGEPFKFRLGNGEVIKGWDVGIEGMKVGGKRRLTIPPKMAYGDKKMGNDIPANSTLVFEVECKFVK